MVEYMVKQPSIGEMTEIAQLTYEALQASARFDRGRTLESVLDDVTETCIDESTEVVMAFEDGHILGWTSVFTGFPLMMFIGEWAPIIRVGVEPEPIAVGLIEKTKELLTGSDHTRLEIEIPDITEATEPDMKTYARWYSQCGFNLVATEVHMMADVQPVELEPPPEDFGIKKLSDVGNADVEGPFYECFDNGQDQLYLSLDRAQKGVTFRYFFDRRRPMLDDASLVLCHKDRVVGFVVAREKNGAADIGPVGIIPEYRGRGLSKPLMSYSMNALYSEGVRVATLDASESNTRARNLYEKYGFTVQNLKAFLVWTE